jgi:hypothetical protein
MASWNVMMTPGSPMDCINRKQTIEPDRFPKVDILNFSLKKSRAAPTPCRGAAPEN